MTTAAAARASSDGDHPAGEPGSWQQRLRGHFAGRLELHCHADAAGRWLVVGTTAEQAPERVHRLTVELADRIARQGVTAVPVVYSAAELVAADGGAGGAQLAAAGAEAPAELRRLAGVLDAHAGRRALLQLLQREGRDYRAIRRLVLRAVQTDAELIDLVERRSTLPTEVGLRLAADALADALGWLYAAWGDDYRGVAGDVQSFEQQRRDGAPFSANAVLTCWQLQGLARQARHLLGRAGDDQGMRGRWRGALIDAGRFLRQLRRYLSALYTTAAERRNRRRRYLIAGVATLAVAAGLVAVHLRGREPIEPVQPSALKGRPGSIAAQYFADPSLLRPIRRRAETQIKIETSRSPAPGVHFDNFSVRYEGFLRFAEGGASRLCVLSDEGARVYLAGRRLLDDWWSKSRSRTCATVYVKRGWYPLRLEFFDTKGKSVLRLERDGDEIPSADLCCR